MPKNLANPKKHEKNKATPFLNVFEVPDSESEVRISIKILILKLSNLMTLIVCNCKTFQYIKKEKEKKNQTVYIQKLVKGNCIESVRQFLAQWPHEIQARLLLTLEQCQTLVAFLVICMRILHRCRACRSPHTEDVQEWTHTHTWGVWHMMLWATHYYLVCHPSLFEFLNVSFMSHEFKTLTGITNQHHLSLSVKSEVKTNHMKSEVSQTCVTHL